MFEHDPWTFPNLSQVNAETGRVYRVNEGNDVGRVYPSITRCLAAKPKPALEAWKARVGATEASRVSRQATRQGTTVHALVEDFLGNEPLPTPDPFVMELWLPLREWLTTHITCVHAQEADVYSRMLRVAGRLDLVASCDGAPAVIDFKTASRAKKEAHIEDYFLQGTFYAAAIFERTGRIIKRIIVPFTSPDGLQIFETRPVRHFTTLIDRIKEFYTLNTRLDSFSQA